MKLCKDCGAQNSDARAFCIDCGERLGKPLAAAEAAKAEAELDAALERGYQNSEELRATRAEKIFAVVLALGFIAACVGFFLAPPQSGAQPYFLIAAIPLPIALVLIFGGRLMWRWERWKLSLRYDLDKEQISVPTTHIVGRKISIWFLGIIALAVLAFALMQVFLPEAPGQSYYIVDGRLVPIP